MGTKLDVGRRRGRFGGCKVCRADVVNHVSIHSTSASRIQSTVIASSVPRYRTDLFELLFHSDSICHELHPTISPRSSQATIPKQQSALLIGGTRRSIGGDISRVADEGGRGIGIWIFSFRGTGRMRFGEFVMGVTSLGLLRLFSTS